MAIILDGKKLAERILDDFKGRRGGRKLRLAAVLVGSDTQSKIFLHQKERACRKIGVDFQLYQFTGNIGQEELAKEVKKIVRQKLCHGIIIQLPLPGHINADKILRLIPAKKDVDVLSGRKTKVLSPVLAGILALLKEYRIDFKNKKVAVVGAGRLVGQPVLEWLAKQHTEITKNIKTADIVISGVGKPGFVIKGNMIKRGTVVIDAAGDAEQKSVGEKAGYFTPTPGGVGPMTVAMVLKNLLILNDVLVD